MKLFGGGSRSRGKEDIQRIKEIRDIVDGSAGNVEVDSEQMMLKRPPEQPAPPRFGAPPARNMKGADFTVRSAPVMRPPEPVRAAPANPQSQGISPPLFIKVEKYKDIVSQIQSLRSQSLTLRDALDALFEMEKEIKNGLDMAQKTLDNFNTTLLALDGMLIRSQGLDSTGPNQEARELEEYVKSVYKQVERLRSDMKTITAASDMENNDL
jgi:hypothetical protein